MSYRTRFSLLAVLDSLIVFTSVYLSYLFLHSEFSAILPLTLIFSSFTLLFSYHIFSIYFKLYKKAWEYASVGEVFCIFKVVTFSIISTLLVQFIVSEEVYIRIFIIAWMLHMLFIGGTRFVWFMLRKGYKKSAQKKRTLIIGAGSAGTMVARQLLQSKETDLYPVAFVDDNQAKHKLEIFNIPVVAATKEIERVVEDYDIEHIIIAIPSLSRKEIHAIFEECAKAKIKTQIVPMLEDIIHGRVSINEFHDVSVEDLLGREPVQLDDKGISETITGKTILVTGAGGSIGSEICRQAMNYKPTKIVLLGHGENSIYTIEMELHTLYKDGIEIVTEIADVQDRNRMLEVMEKHRPYIVYHAAAHKHVPLMERSPKEAVKNNVIGTKNVAEAADVFRVNTFVMVSTDKAVNPTSVMGATKRIAEMVVQHMDTVSRTRFVTVRFGNVLGSRGSVIPLFKKQIQQGGPVTVTHPDMVRYFMTIPEASRLVIQAGALARGGEIFVLDMGEPVKIVDLATRLITLSGYRIDDIGIAYTGVRPGEKLFEELLGEEEVHSKQIYPKIYVGKQKEVDRTSILHLIESFEELESEMLRVYILNIAQSRKKLYQEAN
ncbi:nucleoside-diphosphate sugar epimerase/dehydratase [Bacillus sp. 165]|uniref:polysaccharide biosynthesis protein n=1 Tax=Bacillus sp. 165 TaxID=1529117 RepID=UPI001ADC5C36|nr:nucleoside-diphosphate sugar epimerase/dehydratase [Bacillus sp. 165]MBO9130000.1 polysaccharide biosynthesis protein [Bacillus sp. 165]